MYFNLAAMQFQYLGHQIQPDPKPGHMVMEFIVYSIKPFKQPGLIGRGYSYSLIAHFQFYFITLQRTHKTDVASFGRVFNRITKQITMPIRTLPWLLQWLLITPTLQHISRNSKVFTALVIQPIARVQVPYFTGLCCLPETKRSKFKEYGHLCSKNPSQHWKKIDLPCLIIAAKDDRLIDPKTSLQQKLIRGSELVIVNG